MAEIQLAPGWSVSKVRNALAAKSKNRLIRFLRDRYEKLFFEPIELLTKESKRRRHEDRASQEEWHFGFAIVALCCLLIETFQCYRLGLPSSHRGELKKLQSQYPKIPGQYRVPESEWPQDLGEIFRCFFSNHQNLFPNVKGGDFYQNIRNGLLHQSQTKGKWRIKVDMAALWSEKSRVLDREKLAKQLQDYFKTFQEELKHARPSDQIWQNTRRKIWWLVKLSTARV